MTAPSTASRSPTGFDFRSNTGGTLGYTSTLSSTLLFDVRAAFSKFGEWRQPAQEFDPATLGFAPERRGAVRRLPVPPLLHLRRLQHHQPELAPASLGSQRSDFGTGFNRPFYNFSFAPTVTRVWGDHSLRAGYDLRHRRWNIDNPAYGAGRFHFNGAYTRANNAAPLNEPPSPSPSSCSACPPRARAHRPTRAARRASSRSPPPATTARPRTASSCRTTGTSAGG